MIHIISDLHLVESQPHLLNLFTHYIQKIAPESECLYVLGDLFEVWVGDDNHTNFNQQVIDLFAEYSRHGQLFFAHGNRDFLLGHQFAKACGGELIDEPHLLDWAGQTICMMHGDALCTDDVAYQQLRNTVRSEQWQQQFLSQTVSKRLEIADGIRAKSKDAQQNKNTEIMDVNAQAVFDCFKSNQCQWLIHGHTHREGRHMVDMGDNNTVERVVLSDWAEQGHYLSLKNSQVQSHFFDLEN
ncbi:UDP-2,3-diacylglucosamine diphosphatase [Aliikangiella coralliicola]|uniref:UDP-2,3-diacylglucosamine hydrolase n=1 Tax=Aliikangiella coralliicola TaxID=2592383 RepID=A0A545UBA8_9GAMM|nr:UDP-2,3-diacylglucosamine diphosphatase [Aliikangiella coralliicola]